MAIERKAARLDGNRGRPENVQIGAHRNCSPAIRPRRASGKSNPPRGGLINLIASGKVLFDPISSTHDGREGVETTLDAEGVHGGRIVIGAHSPATRAALAKYRRGDTITVGGSKLGYTRDGAYSWLWLEVDYLFGLCVALKGR
jgi:hypothetical protein